MTRSLSRALGPEPRADLLGRATRRLVQAPWLSKSAFLGPQPGNVGLLRAFQAVRERELRKQASFMDSLKSSWSGVKDVGRGAANLARGLGGMAMAPVRGAANLASGAWGAAPQGLRNAALGTVGTGALGALSMLPAGMAAAVGAPLAAYHAPSGERLKHFLAALKGAGKASLPGLGVTGLSAAMGVPTGAALGAAGAAHGALAGGALGSLFGPVGAGAGALLGGAGGALGPALGGIAGGLYGGLTGAPIGAAISTPGIIRSQVDAVRAAKASRAAADAAAHSREMLSGLAGNVGKGALGLAGAYGAYRFLKDRQDADQQRQYAQPRYYYAG